MKWLPSALVGTIDGSFDVQFIGVNSKSGDKLIYYASSIEVIIKTLNFDLFESYTIIKGF